MASMNVYEIGNAIILSVTFRDVLTELPADPTAAKLRIKDPTGVETVVTGLLLHPSLGVFQHILVPTIPGIWKYRFSGSGAVIVAAERRFEVIHSSFNPPF